MITRKIRNVMTQQVVTVGEQAPFSEVVRLMALRKISALPVVNDNGWVVGIVTERDVAAALADGADPATTKVADYMTDRHVTVRPDEDVAVAARRMAALGVRHLPVIDRGGWSACCPSGTCWHRLPSGGRRLNGCRRWRSW